MNILIIEDNYELSVFLKTVLSDRWGHRVLTASTGRIGMKIAEGNGLDLVILDIYLPDCMGQNLISSIKDSNNGVKIITMTGFNNLDLEKEVRAKGIAYYMIKPIQLEVLRSIIDHLNFKKGGESGSKAKEMVQISEQS